VKEAITARGMKARGSSRGEAVHLARISLRRRAEARRRGKGERGIYARRGQLKFIMSGNRSRACTHLGTRVPARYYD